MSSVGRTLAALALLVLGCRSGGSPPTTIEGHAESRDANGAQGAQVEQADASADRDAADRDAEPTEAKLLSDEAVGPLLARLSENPGAFPSENYVTNETSLLHVAPILRDPKLRRRAYVGVGPEQSYTYLAMLEPRVAYIVDIRRGNFLEHLMFRGCFEAGATRAEFLSALLARRAKSIDPADGGALPTRVGFEPLEAAFRGAPSDAKLRDEGVARTKAVLDRLAIVRAPGDDKEIARIHDSFAKHGLAITYTMLNVTRKYPTLAENFAMRDPDGAPSTFLASEEIYARVRKLVLENRVLPVVGDFGGTHALRAVAEDMKARNLLLGVFYTSNVEQYLFDAQKYAAFVGSVSAMPRDGESRMLRVWFDQGKAHPAQRAGHRTTQLAIRVNTFLDRAAKTPFRSYWDVATQPGD